jgi:hypothetical protein
VNPAQREIVCRLEADWPRWQIWVVNRYIGGALWCARRWEDHASLLHGNTSDELVEYLQEAAQVSHD